MIYLYLGNNTVKLFSLSKTLLGQYNISHFTKIHTSELLNKGKVVNIDIVASAIKEALTSAEPSEVNDKEVTLILPQESFLFARYNIPSDISDTAILPFIRDRVRVDLKINIESTYYEYIVNHQEKESALSFFSQEEDVCDIFKEVFSLLQLKLINIIPESLAYYTLFEKTLRKEKREHVLYVSYQKTSSFGYLYDSLGLVDSNKCIFDKDIKPALKNKVAAIEKGGLKLNRLILSGSQSKTVRQDLFTKDVGAWTNPLDKIIDNFYKDYVKLIIPNLKDGFSLLEFDVCFGAFVFVQEHKDFSLIKKMGKNKSMKRNVPKISFGALPKIVSRKTLAIFVGSFILSFIIIFAASNIDLRSRNISFPAMKEKPTPTPKPKPTDTPTPTPSILREEIKIKILNGSGIKGKAGEIKEVLQDAKYSDILTDNANSFDYEETIIQIKEGKEDAFTLLKDDLKDYTTLSKPEVLDEDEAADVVIILGANIEE